MSPDGLWGVFVSSALLELENGDCILRRLEVSLFSVTFL